MRNQGGSPQYEHWPVAIDPRNESKQGADESRTTRQTRHPTRKSHVFGSTTGASSPGTVLKYRAEEQGSSQCGGKYSRVWWR